MNPARILLGVILTGLLGVALFAPLAEGLVKWVPDDGFYYLEIARRMGAGEGSTFDGIHATNGYHPLWLVLLVPLSPLGELSREASVRVAFAVGVILLGAAIALMERTAARLAPGESRLATVWLSCTVLMASVYGMEAPLAAFLAALLWWTIARGWPAAITGGAMLGGIGSALILARLDAGLVVAGAHAVWLARVARREEAWGPWCAAVAVEGAVVLAYLAANNAAFGEWLPISAILKAARHPGPNLLWLSSLLSMLAVGSLVCGTFASAVARPVPARDALWSAALGTGVNLLALAIGGGRETYNWYFMLPVLASGLFVPVLVEFLRRRGWRAAGAVWAAGAVLLGVAAHGKSRETAFAEKIRRAQWLAVHAPADTVFAEGDCGILAYLSGRPFVNLDGLTNSSEFPEVVDDGTVGDWLLRGGVNAVALPTGVEPATAAWKVRARQKRVVQATLVPWEPPIHDAQYTLWRVVELRVAGR